MHDAFNYKKVTSRTKRKKRNTTATIHGNVNVRKMLTLALSSVGSQ